MQFFVILYAGFGTLFQKHKQGGEEIKDMAKKVNDLISMRIRFRDSLDKLLMHHIWKEIC